MSGALPPLVALAIESRAALVSTRDCASLAARAYREPRQQQAMAAWARAWVCPFAFAPPTEARAPQQQQQAMGPRSARSCRSSSGRT